ncbi:MAG: hypothetical protein COB67_09380 [SAR324 cluster bacterium]|uniref:AP2/ERF domain-containing protein n=1 Tax=SAR324 cluster bacterium TaxID=2024889 RepID=A0A2A4T0C6_9DELT|nr:MAG: hypothetical protein COB67_09380 [SAR324 cluster bacterium]
MTISRIDQEQKYQHGWWVRYFEYGAKRPVAQKFFSDRMYRGREFSYLEAQRFESHLKEKYNYAERRQPEGSPNPDIRRPKIRNKANKTGILGVQRSRRVRPGGKIYEAYIASYPVAPRKNKLHVYSVSKFGEKTAFRLAIMARILGLAGYYDKRYRLPNQFEKAPETEES